MQGNTMTEKCFVSRQFEKIYSYIYSVDIFLFLLVNETFFQQLETHKILKVKLMTKKNYKKSSGLENSSDITYFFAPHLIGIFYIYIFFFTILVFCA